MAYGAAAKGNTLLNFCGVTTADIASSPTAASPNRAASFRGPTCRSCPPKQIFETRPDYVAILPWNLREEISSQLTGIAEWGGRFVTFVPEVRVSS